MPTKYNSPCLRFEIRMNSGIAEYHADLRINLVSCVKVRLSHRINQRFGLDPASSWKNARQT